MNQTFRGLIIWTTNMTPVQIRHEYDREQFKDYLEDFWNQQADWSRAAFGTDAERGPEGPLRHLIKEAGEALGNQKDLTEYADCLFLVFDSCRRAGFSYADLLEACFAKLEVNRSRKWNKPSKDQPVEHVR